MRYCHSPFVYQRRKTREVVVGNPANGGVIIGGEHPVVMQSMLTCDTMDTQASVQQTLDLAIDLNCEFANFYSAMAYPGSPLYAMAIKNGWALPETWSGFSQHSYDCLPLPTEKVAAAEVLKFRDEAFDRYFTSKRYRDMVTQKFGWETRAHIDQMTNHKLRRKIVEEMGGGATLGMPAAQTVA